MNRQSKKAPPPEEALPQAPSRVFVSRSVSRRRGKWAAGARYSGTAARQAFVPHQVQVCG